MSTAAIIAGTAAGGIAAGVGASKAAGTQASAANNAASLEAQTANNALDFQKGTYGNSQQELAPFLNTGYSGLANLAYQMGLIPASAIPRNATGSTTDLSLGNGSAAFPYSVGPDGTVQLNPTTGAGYYTGGSTVAPPSASGINIPTNLGSLVNPGIGGPGSLTQSFPGGPFTAPTAEQAAQDPGYQFGLDEGTKALTNSAAARGDLLSGNTARAITQFGNDYASTKYNDVYNRSLQNYTTNYNTWHTQNQDLYNRLAAMAGIGQTSTAQLATLGQNTAGNVANIDLTAGGQIGGNINNAGAARASGYAGLANAFGSTTSNLSQLMFLNSILGGGGGGGGGTGVFNPAVDPSICWVAIALWGAEDQRTQLVRAWLDRRYRYDRIGKFIVPIYERFGREWAKAVEQHSGVRRGFSAIFNRVLQAAWPQRHDLGIA